jgi:hypothetical protein
VYLGEDSMTDIYCYCIECSREKNESIEVLTKKVVVVNGMVVFHLACGQTVEMSKFGEMINGIGGMNKRWQNGNIGQIGREERCSCLY